MTYESGEGQRAACLTIKPEWTLYYISNKDHLVGQLTRVDTGQISMQVLAASPPPPTVMILLISLMLSETGASNVL